MTKQQIILAIDREIDALPPIPENITKIRNLIDDPSSSSKQIAKYVKRDPSLTANLLRVANSAYYAVISRIDSVDRAITTIGLNKLSSLLLTIGAKKVITERYESMEEVWEFSQKAAFFSQSIMKMRTRSFDQIENAYTAGLLHNIGKIVLLSLSPELMEKIGMLSKKKNVSTHIVEKLSIGMSNAEIGAKITEKWNFPTYISKAIQYQNTPKLVDEEYTRLVYPVYLAVNLAKTNPDTKQLFETLEPKVLENFNIEDEEQLKKLRNSLEQFYNKIGTKE
jgi:HD-like signal output (HDOD) protein